MNRDERDARLENSLQGIEELARDVEKDIAGSFLATLAVEQLLKPAISDVVSPIRRKAISRGKQQAVKTATKVVTKKSTQTDTEESNEEES
jgi:hypothetical protein